MMKVHILDSLTWLYGDSAVPARPARHLDVDVARGGTAAAQVLVESSGPVTVKAAGRCARVHPLLAVPVEKNTGPVGFVRKKGQSNPHVTRQAPFEVFDAIGPPDGQARPGDGRAAFLVQVPIPRGARPGRRDVAIEVHTPQGNARLNLGVTVHPARIPPVSAGTLKYTNWFSLANMADRHGLAPWSPGHWRMIRRYADLMVHGRQNIFWLTAPELFEMTPAGCRLRVRRLRRLVKLFTDAGMHYIEGPHLARRLGGWKTERFAVAGRPKLPASHGPGAEWVGSMCRQLQQQIDRHGWQDRWLQHIADEPIDANADDYRLIAGIVRRHMPGVRVIDAAMSARLAEAIDIWVPQNWHYQRDRAFFRRRRDLGDEVWHYTCCYPGGPYLNRLLDGELLRPLLLHWANALYDLPGFLHWGLNQYKRSQDPFTQSVVDHGDGNQLPAGDTHIVYPGPGGPLSSVRLEAQREGAEDYELLRRLKRKDPARAQAVLRSVIRSFKDYTKDVRAFRRARRRLLRNV